MGYTKVLFVCEKNRNRSPKAAQWYIDRCNELYEIDVSECVKSAGIDVEDDGEQLTQGMIDWANKVFALDRAVGRYIERHYVGFREKLIVLGIPDADYDDETKIPSFDVFMEMKMAHQMDKGCVGTY